MLEYKIDLLATLSKCGYTSYRLRKEKIMGEHTIQQLRKGELASWNTIDKLCTLLDCQPGDLVRYKAERKETK